MEAGRMIQINEAVWCVFQADIAGGNTYDLQYIGTSEDDALAWAQGHREQLADAYACSAVDREETGRWAVMPGDHHWCNRFMGLTLRVSTVIVGVPRASQAADRDPAMVNAMLAFWNAEPDRTNQLVVTLADGRVFGRVPLTTAEMQALVDGPMPIEDGDTSDDAQP